MNPRPHVFVSRRVPTAAMEVIEAACECRVWDQEDVSVPPDRLRQELAEVDGALVMLSDRIDREILAGATRLKMIANMAVGFDNIDTGACIERGVMVSNTPDVLTETTADLVWALLMATARRLVEAQQLVERDEWQSWSPMLLAGQDVHGATLGIIGAGRIGQAVALRARGFGMRILYHNRSRHRDFESAAGAIYVERDVLLSQSDFVVPMVPLTTDTRHLIDSRALRQMKPSAVLVNASRGAVVDEQALQEALEQGWIWAAGLDVWDTEPIRAGHPLLGLPNVVALPHIGSASIATRTRMASLAAENLVAGVTGGVPPTLVTPRAGQRP